MFSPHTKIDHCIFGGLGEMKRTFAWHSLEFKVRLSFLVMA